MAARRTATAEAETPPARPWLADEPSQFMRLEREVEQEFRSRLLASLQNKVNGVAEATRSTVPSCPHCQLRMGTHDSRPVSWQARFGRLRVDVARYRCQRCEYECRPLLDVLGVEPGRISGSLARLLALLGHCDAVFAGGAVGLAAAGRPRQPNGHLAGDAATGSSWRRPTVSS